MNRLIGMFLAAIAFVSIADPAFAAEEGGMSRGLIGLAIGLGLGMAALGAGLGQGRATAAAMESIGRNPQSREQLFIPLILGLALMEALALYMFVISFLLLGQL